MERQEIITFIKANPLFFLASCDGDQARVRGIMMYTIDDIGNIVFSLGKNKALYKQLRENPKIELCFYQNNTQIRVNGELIESENLSLKQEIVSARPFLKPWIEVAGYDVMAVFILTQCSATYWNLENAMSRKRYVKLFEA